MVKGSFWRSVDIYLIKLYREKTACSMLQLGITHDIRDRDQPKSVVLIWTCFPKLRNAVLKAATHEALPVSGPVHKLPGFNCRLA